MSVEITQVTRRAIADYFATESVAWAGREEEGAFLGRLYDLGTLPSTDHRRKNAAGDIHQHRVAWRDWNDDWVFDDHRFDLIRAPDDEFLRFLCETIHPSVRPDPDQARQLVEFYNSELANDGWSLTEVRQISGRPIFAPQKIGQRVEVFDEPTGWEKVDRQLQEARIRLETAESEEHFQSVGLLCREALISVAQEAYDAERHATIDGVAPSATDAKRMLESVIAAELGGGPNEEARRHAKAALSLALATQHNRRADFRMAALSAEAAVSVVNIIAILAGRRGPPIKF